MRHFGKITEQQFHELYNIVSGLESQIVAIQQNPFLLNSNTGASTTIPQAVNMLRNASFSHSVKSWFNTMATDDTQYECYPWYSHPDIPNMPMISNTWQSPYFLFFTNADVNTSTDSVNITAHRMQTGQAVYLDTGSTTPAPLVDNTWYYIIRVDANSFQFAATFADAIAGNEIDLTTTGGASNNLFWDYTLKASPASGFSPLFSVWNLTGDYAGTASINQGYTLDAPITSEEAAASPGYTLYAVVNLARVSQYYSAPTGARLFCGLYAEQDGTWDYLNGDYTITASVRPPVATPTTREYLVHVITDRGFTVNTDVLTLTDAPSDADFSNGAGVVLNWQRALNYGVSAYEIYRKTGSNYVLLFRITNGTTSYIDNNSVLPDTVSAFPTADFTGIYTYSATVNNVLSNLAIDGISPSWDTIPFALRVPSNYDVSLTDLSLDQWVRWGFSGLNGDRFDVRVSDGYVQTDAVTIISTSAQFTADMVGKPIVLVNADITGGTYTGTVDTYVDTDTVTVTPAVTGTGIGVAPVGPCITTVEGGAPLNAVAFDLVHLSYGQNAIFSFNPQDMDGTHGIPPVAPNGSNQGGTGTIEPGGGDGQPSCVWTEERVIVSRIERNGRVMRVHDPESVRAIDVRKDDFLIDKSGMLHRVAELTYNVADIYRVTTANGYSARVSGTHKFISVLDDTQGRRVQDMAVGDSIVTSRNGEASETVITAIEQVDRSSVVQFMLSGGHEFLCGEALEKDEGEEWGGIASHNLKGYINVIS